MMSVFSLFPVVAVLLLFPESSKALNPCQNEDGTSDTCWAVQDLGFRSSDDVNGMSQDECYNILVLELEKVCIESVPELHGYNAEEIIGKMYVAETLIDIGIYFPEGIYSVSTFDQRQVLNIEYNKCSGFDIPKLQSYNDMKMSCQVNRWWDNLGC